MHDTLPPHLTCDQCTGATALDFDFTLALIRNIHDNHPRRAIVWGIVDVCGELEIGVNAEGVKTVEENVTLRKPGIDLQQGCYSARQPFESAADVDPRTFDE